MSIKALLHAIRIVALAALFTSAAHAQPYLASDVVKSTDGSVLDYSKITCVYQEGTAAAVVTPLVSNACKANLSAVAVGAHSYQVWFRITDPVWGNVEGPKSPFAYTRPSASVSVPTTIRLQAN